MEALPREQTSLRVRKVELRELGVTEDTWDLETLGFSVAPKERR